MTGILLALMYKATQNVTILGCVGKLGSSRGLSKKKKKKKCYGPSLHLGPSVGSINEAVSGGDYVWLL